MHIDQEVTSVHTGLPLRYLVNRQKQIFFYQHILSEKRVPLIEIADHLEQSLLDWQCKLFHVSQVLLAHLQVSHLSCHVLGPGHLSLIVQVILQRFHVLAFGHFRVLALFFSGSFWLIENIANLFLLQKQSQANVEAMDLHLLLLPLHDFSRPALKDSNLLIHHKENHTEPFLKLFHL